MRRFLSFLVLALPLLISVPCRAADSAKPPNIVFILADDLGYGDLGCFGSTKIRTTNIDQLAAKGMRLTRHYSGNAVCAPSRCVLMTGLHPGHAFIRNNLAVGEEGQYPIPAGTKTLTHRLHEAGYVCGAFGKWGLGGPYSDGRPLQQGINRFFGYNCQGFAHNSQQYPHACYAAMVSRLDRHVGEIVAELEKLGLTQNTIIVFSSDNGPANMQTGGSDSDFFNSAGGLTGKKGSLQEGGIRVPGIACWPGKIASGSVSARITGFEDWTPTLFDLAGLNLADRQELDGISFAETLMGKQQPPRPFLYREFIRQQAVWSGRWKAIRNHLAKADDPLALKTELYDLDADPTESQDVAAMHPQELARLEQVLQNEHRPSEVFPIPALDRR